jgi:hypothetical protein
MKQKLLACMQRDVGVAPTIIEFTKTMGSQFQKGSRLCPISELCLRYLELRSAARRNAMSLQDIRAAAVDIDSKLEVWKGDLETSLAYTVVDADKGTRGSSCWAGKRHVYPTIWSAQVWNSWRTLRILVNQLLLSTDLACEDAFSAVQISVSVSVLRQLSTDLCISASCFYDSPRTSITGNSVPILVCSPPVMHTLISSLYRCCCSHLASVRCSEDTSERVCPAILDNRATAAHRVVDGSETGRFDCRLHRAVFEEP